MASHFSTIGMPIESEEDLIEWANRVSDLAQAPEAPSGVYFRWSDPSGAELWLHATADNELLGVDPHFAGRSAIRIGLTARLPSEASSELDGSFHGWVAPTGEAPDTGSYPLVFHAPDYVLHRKLALPAQKQVQIAAFAHEIAAFETVAAYDASQTGELKYASQSFLPSGLFAAAGDATVTPRAQAIFTGHVLAAEKKINALTGHAFYWALVQTFGGVYDVVIDASLLPGVPAVGGVVSGSFWLSGRISDA